GIGSRGSSGDDFRSSGRVSEPLEPSALVHASELPEHTLEADLLRTFSKYGEIKEICMLPHLSQALIEFKDVESAKMIVENAKSESLTISGRRIKVNYSTSQHIVHRNEGMSTTVENKVLLFTVYKQDYPITVDVLHQICSPHGTVSRIAIFRKFHLHALVEFSRVEDAIRAKRNLNGADIYSGCCTIKVDYSVSQSVTVTRNDQESWDYENPQSCNASLLGQPEGRQPSLLKEPKVYRDQSHVQPQQPPMQAPMQHQPAHIGYGGFWATPPTLPVLLDQFLMVYGLNGEVFNCQRLFNLLCLYGNVVSIKFLRSKEGSAMVQMGDPQAAERAIQNLNFARMFGQKLQLSQSKQTCLVETSRPRNLPDGSPSFIDFSASRNNRFTTPGLAAKNKIYPPFRTLQFWNCPPHCSDEDLRQMFAGCGCQLPEKIARFSNPKAAEKTIAGQVQWARDIDATEALVLANNCEVQAPGQKYPFAVRLSFAAKPIADGQWPARAIVARLRRTLRVLTKGAVPAVVADAMSSSYQFSGVLL
uniref:RRM domain-containing protein n=1 Tax=Macrostomum lignano TaxID=282301 RepID=A0A1I8FU07_9PLAT